MGCEDKKEERRTGDKDIKEVKERKKEIILPVFCVRQCFSSSITGIQF
jgi:hypothetical protein